MEDLKQAIEFYNFYLVSDPDSGKFYWKPRNRNLFKSEIAFKQWNSKYAEKEALTSLNKGYLRSQIDNKHHYAHRVMWIMNKREVPIFVDHKNGITIDNKLENLRNVTPLVNSKNRKIPKNNYSGYMGISKYKDRWRARIKVDGKDIHIGFFDDIDEAIKARKEAEEQYGFYENHGRC